MKRCSRIVFMNKGKVEFDGAYDALVSQNKLMEQIIPES